MSALTIAKPLDLASKVVPLLVQQLRFRRVNLKHPVPMRYERKLLYETCKPVIKTVDVCDRMLVKEKETASIVDTNPYALFLAGKMRRMMSSHQMTAIFHTDHYRMKDIRNLRLFLYDNNFPMTIEELINYKIATAAFQGTRWAPVVHLCAKRTAFGYCETLDVVKLLKVMKKTPSFHLIGLVYENRLLHKDDVDNLVKLSNNIAVLQSQLCTVLGNPTMSLCQTTMMSQTGLTNSLGSIAKGESSTSSSSSSSSSSSDSDSDKDDKKNVK